MVQESSLTEEKLCQPSPVRVGAVSFLNTKPLIYPLLNKDIPTDMSLSVQVPSQLASLLKSGKLDVGLIPIIEYFRSPDAGYRILPDISIASHGNVLSIQLFSHVPIQEIQRVALDTSSRSSIALLKILLAEQYGLHPEFTACDPSVNPNAPEVSRYGEAVLLIGDAALRQLNTTQYSLDLGAAWHEFTGLPFVYACWVAREGVDLGEVPEVLQTAKARGIPQIPEIARMESPKLGLPESLCRDYLQKHICYDLGECELAGLQKFYQLAVKHGLAEPGATVLFT